MGLETHFHVKLYLWHFLTFGDLTVLSLCFLNLVFLLFLMECLFVLETDNDQTSACGYTQHVPANCLQASPGEEHPVFGSRNISPYSTTLSTFSQIGYRIYSFQQRAVEW